MKGFHAWLGNKDYFFVTNRRLRTEKLAGDVLASLNYPDTKENRAALQKLLTPGELTTRRLKNGRAMWSVKTKGNCICGLIGEPDQVVIKEVNGNGSVAASL